MQQEASKNLGFTSKRTMQIAQGLYEGVELKDYGDRGLLLTVKSGLTGLAQGSGRRNISFNERRALDVYYVQNWSFALDAQIFFRTIASVLHHVGAK